MDRTQLLAEIDGRKADPSVLEGLDRYRQWR